MRNADEILEDLRGVISGILERPQMYVADLDLPGGASGLDALLYQLVRQWCWIQDRGSEFFGALTAVATAHGVHGTQSYLIAYRERHPSDIEAIVVSALIGYWRELALQLALELNWPPRESRDDQGDRPREPQRF